MRATWSNNTHRTGDTATFVATLSTTNVATPTTAAVPRGNSRGGVHLAVVGVRHPGEVPREPETMQCGPGETAAGTNECTGSSSWRPSNWTEWRDSTGWGPGPLNGDAEHGASLRGANLEF